VFEFPLIDLSHAFAQCGADGSKLLAILHNSVRDPDTGDQPSHCDDHPSEATGSSGCRKRGDACWLDVAIDCLVISHELLIVRAVSATGWVVDGDYYAWKTAADAAR